MNQNLDPAAASLASPVFPSIRLRVYDDNVIIMEFEKCQPHQLSAVLALMQDSWKIEIIASA